MTFLKELVFYRVEVKNVRAAPRVGMPMGQFVKSKRDTLAQIIIRSLNVSPLRIPDLASLGIN
jgi:hypothetical protein